MGELRLGNVAQGLQDLLQSLGLSRDSPGPDKPQTQGFGCDKGKCWPASTSVSFVIGGMGQEKGCSSHQLRTISCLCSLGEMGFTCFINQTDFPRNLLSVMTNYMLQHINGRVVVSPALLSVMKVGCFQEQGRKLRWE